MLLERHAQSITNARISFSLFFWFRPQMLKYVSCAGHEGRVTGLALLPDWTLASVSHDRTIRLWDLHTFKLMKTVKDAHETPLQGINYSSSKEEFVTWAMDNFAYVWDAVTLNTKYALVGHTAEVTQVCLAPVKAVAFILNAVF